MDGWKEENKKVDLGVWRYVWERRWSAIATHLPKRTDNEIKNYWNTHLKKRLAKMGIDPITHKPKNESTTDGQSKSAANLSHMAQWESARLEAEARLVRQSKLRGSGSGSSFQAQTSEFASTSKAPPPCLDVLKAWTGGWSGKTTDGAAAAELESPTSTLSSAAGAAAFVRNSAGSCDGGLMKEEGGEEWKDLAEEALQETAAWVTDPVRESSEHVPSGNFVEKFTDLLLSTSSGDRCFSDDGGESDNGSGGGDYYEDNKNYWNNILNLVNASPSSDSPIF